MQPKSQDNKVLNKKKNVSSSKRQNKGARPVIVHPGFPAVSTGRYGLVYQPTEGYHSGFKEPGIPSNFDKILGTKPSPAVIAAMESGGTGAWRAPLSTEASPSGFGLTQHRGFVGPNVQLRRLPKKGVVHQGRYPIGIPRNGLNFPPSVYVALRFFAEYPITLSALTYGNYRFRPTGAFDIDPLVGGTSMPGFTEWAQLYATYRVTCSKIRVEVVNPSLTQSVMMIVHPMNADPGASTSLANVTAAEGNAYAKSKLCCYAGGPRNVITNYMTTEKIFGDPMVWTDHNFSSLCTTVPANNWFWQIGAYTPAVIPTNPVQLWIHIEIGIEFYDRIELPN